MKFQKTFSDTTMQVLCAAMRLANGVAEEGSGGFLASSVNNLDVSRKDFRTVPMKVRTSRRHISEAKEI